MSSGNLLKAMKRLMESLRRYLRGKVMYIGGSDTLPPPLSREEEADLIFRLSEGDQHAKPALIERNLRLVVYIARRFETPASTLKISYPSEPSVSSRQSIPTTRTKTLSSPPTPPAALKNEILMYLRKNATQRVEVSFDEPLNTDWDGNELLLSDILGTDNDLVIRPIEDDVDKKLLLSAIGKLSDRERQIIFMRFGLDGGQEKTQKEVADMMGISQSYISRLEKRIILRLRREITRLT
jgi:RNA polymerase sporulation-specific sigma factor